MRIKLLPSEEARLWLDVAKEAAGALMCVFVPGLVVAALYLALRFAR